MRHSHTFAERRSRHAAICASTTSFWSHDPIPCRGFLANLADTLFGMLLEYLLMAEVRLCLSGTIMHMTSVQIFVVGYFGGPYLGPALSVAINSWLLALMCFEYTWSNAGGR